MPATGHIDQFGFIQVIDGQHDFVTDRIVFDHLAVAGVEEYFCGTVVAPGLIGPTIAQFQLLEDMCQIIRHRAIVHLFELESADAGSNLV